MTYITFVTLLLLATSGICSLYRHLMILQQNSYFPSRYFNWLKESYTTELAIIAVLYSAITIGIIKEELILALVLAAVLTVLRVILNITTHKKAVKKLRFTVRIKALYITAIIILGVLLLVSATSSNIAVTEVCRTLCLLLSIVTPALTFVVWGIVHPIEIMIQRFKSR